MRELKDTTALILDSDLQVRHEASCLLQKLGVKTVLASTAAEGLAILNVYTVKLLILRHPSELPNGYGLWNELQRSHKNLKIVFIREHLSSHAEQGVIVSTPLGVTLRNEVLKALFPTPSKTKRVHDRTETTQQVNWGGKAEEQHQEGTLQNISIGGAFIKTEAKLPQPGAVIELETYFGKDEIVPFQGIGVVRWVQEASPKVQGFGIEFVFLTEIAQDFVDNLTKNN